VHFLPFVRADRHLFKGATERAGKVDGQDHKSLVQRVGGFPDSLTKTFLEAERERAPKAKRKRVAVDLFAGR
jgi:hypothetical protein